MLNYKLPINGQQVILRIRKLLTFHWNCYALRRAFSRGAENVKLVFFSSRNLWQTQTRKQMHRDGRKVRHANFLMLQNTPAMQA